MDSLSSFGKVRTMEQDLAAARNKQRPPDSPRTAKDEELKAAQEIQAPITPVSNLQKTAPMKPAIPSRFTDSVRQDGPQIPSAQKKEMPIPPPLPPRVRAPRPPVAPQPLPAPGVKPSPPTAGLDALSPRPTQPRASVRSAMPAPTPPQIREIGQAPAKQDISRFLPVEEEEAIVKPLPSIEAKKPPLAPALSAPSQETGAIVRPQAPSRLSEIPIAQKPPVAPETPRPAQAKGLTPEEILGMKLSTPPPAAGFRVPAPPAPPIPPHPANAAPAPSMAPPAQPARPIPPSPPSPPPPPLYQPPYNKQKKELPLGLITVAIALLVAAGGLFVWRAIHTNILPPNQTPPPITVHPPSPFFKPDNTVTITMQQGKENFLVEQIRALENNPGNPQSIDQILIKKSPDNVFLETKEFFSAVGVSIPQELLDDLGDQFMLYIYTPGPAEKNRCTASSITDASCSSPRLGIILQITNGKETAMQNIMNGLEPTLLQSFKPLILGAPAFEKATSWDTANYTGFSISYPQGLPVRYSNLPISTTSLNWAEANSYLVIATSKNSSYSVLDKLIMPTAPTAK